MGAARARTPGGPGPLFWPLLPLLLALSPAVHPGPQPGSPSQAPGQAGRRPGARAGGAQGCGQSAVQGKVFGGQDAEAGRWPWQASLLYLGKHLCGAVLIDCCWLLSTAHCFINNSQAPEDYQVLLGNTQLYQQTRHTRKVSVSQIITHPDFEKFHPFGNDIAMLQLQLPVDFTPHVLPACLPTPDMQLPRNMSCWITGWGMLSEDTQLSPPFSLQEGKVELVENEVCNILYTPSSGTGQDYSVDKDMLCAGDFYMGKAICRGDSGGPLVCYHLRAWVLVGLASWGLDCQPPVYPSVFTRVAYFTSWISGVKKLHPAPEPVPHTDPRPSGAARLPSPTRLLLPWVLLAPWPAPG